MTGNSENSRKRQRQELVRDCANLYASGITLQCALIHRCIPCAYKIANFDVALDTEFCRQIPNQRPEQCPRFHNPANGGNALGYKRGMKVLTIGDGDFSFSLALARVGCQVVATSYETKETIIKCYRSVNVAETLCELEKYNTPVVFGVDATRIEETLPAGVAEKYQRIVWNFPCSATRKGQDAQNAEMAHNKSLIRGFVCSATPFLAAKGQIHMNHKTKPPFDQWDIVQVVLSAESTIRYCGRVVLDRLTLPPYVPRKALDRKSFPCHDACSYVFDAVTDGNRNQSNPLDAARTLQNENDIEDFLLSSKNVQSSLLPITPEIIGIIRARLLQTSAKKGHRSTFKKSTVNA
jgi:25S rRNA (uracil2634-N3)-methyltransferase